MQDAGFVRGAFSRVARRYVLANHVLSLGIDVWWRRRVARQVAAFEPEMILDLATGSGDLAEAIRKQVPRARVVAADFCRPMLDHARRRGLEDLVVADGMALPFSDGTFDVVTIGFGLRNMASWPGALQEMARVIRPGGSLVVLDFSSPGGWLAGPYDFYLNRVLPTVAGMLTGEKGAYEYLGDSIGRFPSGKDMCALIDANGFGACRQVAMSGGIVSMYVARRPGADAGRGAAA